MVKSPLGQDFTGSSDPHPLSSDENVSIRRNFVQRAGIILTARRISLFTGAGDFCTLYRLASAIRRSIMWLDLHVVRPTALGMAIIQITYILSDRKSFNIANIVVVQATRVELFTDVI